jgi:hypothetical protein
MSYARAVFTPILVAFGCGVLGQRALHHFSLYAGRRELHVLGIVEDQISAIF